MNNKRDQNNDKICETARTNIPQTPKTHGCTTCTPKYPSAHHFIAVFEYQTLVEQRPPNGYCLIFGVYLFILSLTIQTSTWKACNMRIITLRVRDFACIRYITDPLFAHLFCVPHQRSPAGQSHASLRSGYKKRLDMVQVSACIVCILIPNPNLDPINAASHPLFTQLLLLTSIQNLFYIVVLVVV